MDNKGNSTGFKIYVSIILTVIAFWLAVTGSAIAFLAYEEWCFENQPPQFAGGLMVPPQQQPEKGQSF